MSFILCSKFPSDGWKSCTFPCNWCEEVIGQVSCDVSEIPGSRFCGNVLDMSGLAALAAIVAGSRLHAKCTVTPLWVSCVLFNAYTHSSINLCWNLGHQSHNSFPVLVRVTVDQEPCKSLKMKTKMITAQFMKEKENAEIFRVSFFANSTGRHVIVCSDEVEKQSVINYFYRYIFAWYIEVMKFIFICTFPDIIHRDSVLTIYSFIEMTVNVPHEGCVKL